MLISFFRKMKRIIIILIFNTSILIGQKLSVGNDSYIFMSENSSISIDGLQLSPNSNYLINGPSEFDSSPEAITIGDNSSINRVYYISPLLTDFSGLINFKYEDDELNGIMESDLVLEIKDVNDVWANVTPLIDENNNILTYDFSDFISFTAITASSQNGTLTIEQVASDSFIKLYPNPTSNFIHIESNLNYRSSIYNTAGQLILESDSNRINVINLPDGVYLLHLKSDQNNSVFKIIKKK